MMSNCIGLDISKRLIAVHIPINNSDIEINNNITGMRKLSSKLKKLYKKAYNDLVFIYEPTGNYSAVLTKYCHTKNISCFIINPSQFSNHAKALGQRVKSDKLDAQVLSKALHLARDGEVKVPPYNEVVEEIKELMGYYRFITKSRVQSSNHLEALDAKNGSSYAMNDLKESIEKLRLKEKEIIANIKAIIATDDNLSKGYDNIRTVTGIADIGGIALLHLFIKYPDANQRQITSLAGLDPIDKSSGTSIHSKSKISKAGSVLYRGSLFLGTLSAIRYDENLTKLFERLTSKGKHTTVAQIAVMRKMIIIAHSLYKNDKVYDKELYKKRTTTV